MLNSPFVPKNPDGTLRAILLGRLSRPKETVAAIRAETTDRLGSITKLGSKLARFVLGQMVLHALRRDPTMKQWYGRIKRPRGAKIARAAAMRRLTTILWHMVKHNVPYQQGGLGRSLRSTASAAREKLRTPFARNRLDIYSFGEGHPRCSRHSRRRSASSSRRRASFCGDKQVALHSQLPHS